MALLGNGFRQTLTGRMFGSTMTDGTTPHVHEYRGHMAAPMRNQLASFDSKASIPDGCRHPVAWVMPQKSGGLSTRNSIIGIGSLSATLQSGYNLDGEITGVGGITDAPLGLIVSIAATLIASGGISSASAGALASLVAALTGSSNVSATAAGLAALGASLTGSGTAVGNNTQLMSIAATIRGYGDLTPEGIRDSVWNAFVASYNAAGTMGKALGDVGAGSNPWDAVIESGFTAREILQILAAVAAGKTDIIDLGGGNATVTFRDLADTKDRIEAAVTGSERTTLTLDTDP
jgi:hypothetical protein